MKEKELKKIFVNDLQIDHINKKSVTFVDSDDNRYFASSRVANDILNKKYTSVYVEEVNDLIHGYHQNWLCTPTRW